MVVRIRLQRHGHIYRPFYRIAVANSERHVSKKVLDYVGTYDPLVDQFGNKQLRLNIPRVKYWLAVGAQPSDTMRRLLAQFQLLPQPVIKSTAPADAALIRGLTGRGGREEQKGAEEEEEGRQIRAQWIFPQTNSTASSASTAAAEQPRLKHRHTPQPTDRTFPFPIAPTEATMTAWQKAREIYQRGQASGKQKDHNNNNAETVNPAAASQQA